LSRPSHEPTEKTRTEVLAYAAVGVPHHNIAALVSMSIHTLLKYYQDELDLGKAKANAQVAKSLFQQAVAGNITAQIFWLKAQAGWREVQVIETRSDELRGPDADQLAKRLAAALLGRTGGEAAEDTAH
jgi:hypothetical protein